MRFLLIVAIMLVSAAHADVGDAGWHPRVGQKLPLGGEWKDEGGRMAKLSDFVGAKPSIFVLGYFHCTGLCPLTFRGAQEAIGATRLATGKDFDFAALSIDAADTIEDAMDAKHRAGFETLSAHFLIGTHHAVDEVVRAVGFGYSKDEHAEQFAHPAGLVVVNSRGIIASYLFGVRFDASALRQAILSADRGSPMPLPKPLLLLCYHFDPHTGQYTFAVLKIAQFIAGATVLALAFLWWRLKA